MQRVNLDYKNITFNIIFVLSCLFFVCFLWRKPFLLTAVLVVISSLGLYKWKTKETFALFFIGGVVGVLGEAIAIYSGAWVYTLPDIFGIPYWLPILWGDAAIFSYHFAMEIKKLIPQDRVV